MALKIILAVTGIFVASSVFADDPSENWNPNALAQSLLQQAAQFNPYTNSEGSAFRCNSIVPPASWGGHTAPNFTSGARNFFSRLGTHQVRALNIRCSNAQPGEARNSEQEFQGVCAVRNSDRNGEVVVESCTYADRDTQNLAGSRPMLSHRISLRPSGDVRASSQPSVSSNLRAKAGGAEGTAPGSGPDTPIVAPPKDIDLTVSGH